MQEEEEGYNDPVDIWLEEQVNKFKCKKCNFKGLKEDCDTTEQNVTTRGGERLLIVTYHCPKCGEEVDSDEYPSGLGVGPDYGDFDPDHVGWDSGDYGDYGGE